MASPFSMRSPSWNWRRAPFWRRRKALARTERQLDEVTAQRDDLARKLDENFREGEKIIKDLRDTLQALDYKNQRLKDELDEMRNKEVKGLTLGLRPMDNPPTDPTGRKILEEQLQRELGDALRLEHERVEIIGLHKGSVKVDVNILPHPQLQGPTAKQATDALILQVRLHSSMQRERERERESERGAGAASEHTHH